MGSSDTKLQPIAGPAAWTAAGMRTQKERWTRILNDAQRQDLDRALEPYRNTAPRYERITRETLFSVMEPNPHMAMRHCT